MARKRKLQSGFKMVRYNEYFQYNNKRWEVVHKDGESVYAVELDSKGKAGGAIEKFFGGYLVPRERVRTFTL